MTFQPTASVTSIAPALSRIGRFYITRELGRGTVGCVYLGHDPVIGRDLAIKTFNPRLTLAEKSRYEQQFLNEARAAGCLSHPHIATIYDASVENGATYIAMEYLQGRELSKLLDNGHRFRPDEAASIGWKIADALDHAHRNDVVHRDIKPANIFMVKDEMPKLVDFGIARAPKRAGSMGNEAIAADNWSYTIFQNNKLFGTPAYMSPEQASGKPAGPMTDIYSLGAVMYEMLVGQKPFQSSSVDKLLSEIAFRAPPAPHEVDPNIPMALSHIVMKAMSKRPEKRYPTAEAMALDLKRFLLRERRAMRRMKLDMVTLERRAPRKLSFVGSRLFWAGCLSLTTAAAVVAVKLLR
ncbi:serine/threonine-protein kinase [Noviherbaspirillum autotrophicum]|uniref:serine/threonine-protein kinase n=1 Tax=Noviherbaspirillum autotrophicum TaxID=709839 RepID=UPI000694E325|nr:serine/threonine-protein kinase [Noviherbaspirillum autotrophicum]